MNNDDFGILKQVQEARVNQRPCICGNNLKVKKCCKSLIEAVKSRKIRELDDIKIFLTYKDLWPTKDNDLKEIISNLCSFDVLDAIQTLSKINCLIYREDSAAVSLVILKDALPKWYITKIRLWVHFKFCSIIFSRQVILFASQIIVSQKTNSTKKIMVSENLEVFFDCLLRLSDHISTSQNFKRDSNKELEIIKNSQIELMTNAHFNQSNLLRSILPRNYILYTECIPEVRNKNETENLINFEEVFFDNFNLTPEESLILGFSIWSIYGAKELGKLFGDSKSFLIGPRYYSKIVDDDFKKRTKSIFSMFSTTMPALERKYFDILKNIDDSCYVFKPFFDTPLIDTKNNTYFPIDIVYFEQRITNGLVWLLNDKLKKDDPKKSDSLLQLFGRAREKYVEKLLYNYFPQSKKCYLLSEARGEIEGCDFVYVEDNNIILIEIKSAFLPVQKLISGDPDLVVNTIKDEWFATGDKDRGSINQLNKYVEEIKADGLMNLNGKQLLAPDEINNCWPLIGYFESIPLHPAAWKLLDNILVEHDVSKEFVENFSILDVEEIEMYCSLLKSGHKINDILEIKKKDYVQWKTSHKNWLLRHYGKVGEIVELGQAWDEIFKSTKKKLFSKKDSK